MFKEYFQMFELDFDHISVGSQTSITVPVLAKRCVNTIQND